MNKRVITKKTKPYNAALLHKNTNTLDFDCFLFDLMKNGILKTRHEQHVVFQFVFNVCQTLEKDAMLYSKTNVQDTKIVIIKPNLLHFIRNVLISEMKKSVHTVSRQN